jgi:hypothetical protein
VPSYEIGHGEVSSKLGDVEALRKRLENYVAPYKGEANKGKKKPNDYGVVGKAITKLKEAEKVFAIDESEMFSSAKAKNAEKKVDSWIRKNTTNAAGIGKALDFREKVLKASKKTKSSAGASTQRV